MCSCIRSVAPIVALGAALEWHLWLDVGISLALPRICIKVSYVFPYDFDNATHRSQLWQAGGIRAGLSACNQTQSLSVCFQRYVLRYDERHSCVEDTGKLASHTCIAENFWFTSQITCILTTRRPCCLRSVLKWVMKWRSTRCSHDGYVLGHCGHSECPYVRIIHNAYACPIERLEMQYRETKR